MDVNGCGWVRWGVGGTGNTKTRQTGGIQGLVGPDLGPMVGEISPDIMFCAFLAKMVKNECRWVRMDKNACNGVYGHGGREKTRQKESGMGAQDIFWHAWTMEKQTGTRQRRNLG